MLTGNNVPESYTAGYRLNYRTIEAASIAAFVAISVALAVKLASPLSQNLALIPLCIFSGWLGADLVSGLVHWMGDTWGTPDWPLIGNALIRSFREHHFDQKAITRHDFVETNGNNCLISLPLMLVCLAWPVAGTLSLYVITTLAILTLWVFATNQIHKWAHEDSPAKWIRLLQRTGLILSPEHHSIHHAAPFAKYYCITTGWMNPVLTSLRFFPALEWLVTRITGALPRAHDRELGTSP